MKNLSQEKIYSSINGITPSMNEIIVLTGGKFDGGLHVGHIDFLKILSSPLAHPLLLRGEGGENLQKKMKKRFGKKSVKLVVAVAKDERIVGRLPRRPIFPIELRMKQLAQLPFVSAVYPTTQDLSKDASMLRPDVVGFSETTMDFHSEERRLIRSRVRQMGIIALILPQLIESSTTNMLQNFFLGKEPQQFNIDYTGGVFPLLFSSELTLTPDDSSIAMAKLLAQEVNEGKKQSPLRYLELGVGSGVFTSTFILNSFQEVEKVCITDIDDIALSIGELNVRRAFAFARKNEPEITVLRSDWFNSVPSDKYDVIYANPPFFTADVKRPVGFEKNPITSLYPTRLTFHYEAIFAKITNYISAKSTVIVRVPKTDGKVREIKSVMEKYLNLNVFGITDMMVESGRYLILRPLPERLF